MPKLFCLVLIPEKPTNPYGIEKTLILERRYCARKNKVGPVKFLFFCHVTCQKSPHPPPPPSPKLSRPQYCVCLFVEPRKQFSFRVKVFLCK
jgi:hypothetical protein